MKNKYFRGNQDYICADTGLIAILDVIKSIRDSCAGDLKLSDKGCFFHLSYACRSICMRLRIRIMLFICSMYLLTIDLSKTKTLKDTLTRKENIATNDVSNDLIANMKITREYIKSVTVDQKDKKFKQIDGELNIIPVPCEKP